MRLLFVGENWQGSNARSLREALSRRGDLVIADIGLDQIFPIGRGLILRASNRLLRARRQAELEATVLQTCADFQPDCVMIYKGWDFSAGFMDRLKALGAGTVNCFPDSSPHAHGAGLARAVGEFDLVISAKPFHPPLWGSVYGYSNPCVLTPHGYDPRLHLRDTPPSPDVAFDLIMVATGRAEYFELIGGLAERLGDRALKVAIGGNGWEAMSGKLPAGWETVGVKSGHPYADWLRRGRIAIAPLQRRVLVGGVVQPGDEDSARTYELAAAHCFFIHKRTDFVQTLYDEASEVPFYDDAADLADKIVHYLADPPLRAAMAARAHARAVPAYSTDARAAEILGQVKTLLGRAA